MTHFSKSSISQSILEKSPSTLTSWIKSGKIYPPHIVPLGAKIPKYDLVDAFRICIILYGHIPMEKIVNLYMTELGWTESNVYMKMSNPKSIIGIEFNQAMADVRKEIASGEYPYVNLKPHLLQEND